MLRKYLPMSSNLYVPQGTGARLLSLSATVDWGANRHEFGAMNGSYMCLLELFGEGDILGVINSYHCYLACGSFLCAGYTSIVKCIKSPQSYDLLLLQYSVVDECMQHCRSGPVLPGTLGESDVWDPAKFGWNAGLGVGGWISKKPWFLPHIVIHRENGGNVGVIPLTSKPIYTWKSGYLIGSQSTFSDLRIRWVQKQGYHGFGGWNLNKIHKFLNFFDVPNTPFSWCLW